MRLALNENANYNTKDNTTDKGPIDEIKNDTNVDNKKKGRENLITMSIQTMLDVNGLRKGTHQSISSSKYRKFQLV